MRSRAHPTELWNLFAGLVYPHTDNAAHVGGLLGGWLAGLVLARSLQVQAERPHG